MFFSGAIEEEGRLEESGAAFTSALISSGTTTPGLLIRDGFGYLFGCHFFGLLSSIVNN
jgi:hypothetical protein